VIVMRRPIEYISWEKCDIFISVPNRRYDTVVDVQTYCTNVQD